MPRNAIDKPHLAVVLLAALGGCGVNQQDGLILSITSDGPVDEVLVTLRDDKTKEVIFPGSFVPVNQPNFPQLDLRVDPLPFALRLNRGGSFTVRVIGRSSTTTDLFFWVSRVQVAGPTKIDARLLTVQSGNDADGDLWPNRTTWPVSNPAAAEVYRGRESLLDCNDDDAMPLNADGTPIAIGPADVNPFASEECSTRYDSNCDGTIAPCADEDGDGDIAGNDCDDHDDARHHATTTDLYPDPPNCCGYSLGKTGADAKMNFLGQAICPKARCGDGVDQSCSGHDTPCVVDEDCDGVPAPPIGNDCDDHDPKAYPGADEPCGATKDLDCSGGVNDKCVPCDIDGDGYQRMDPANGCPDARNGSKPFDCNDYDAGVFPGQTSKPLSSSNPSTSAMTEAGNDATSRIVGALRGNCRTVYQSTGTSGTAKIAMGGVAVGDADCNGTAFEGCPSPSCDADGDGWPNANTPTCNPNGLALDCNDNDPTIFPGAPDKCGNGIAENCTADNGCVNDADGDGYPAAFDCNDQNANVHPWATELCNGIDDDCDGLVDEGNPDPSGAPLVTTGVITACTYSNIGECGNTKGLCACSSANPNARLDSQRMACPGEQSAAAGSTHAQCYGAGRGKPQTCDATNKRDDDCDGRVDDPSGVNLGALKGMPCGLNQGGCRQGVVTGCDYSRDNPYFTFGLTIASGGTAATRGYVCSSDTVSPSTEVCDGIDNDCRNDLSTNTTPDERDRDGDKWLACSPFVGTPTATVLGGGDCNDTVGTTFPGAPELCDNVDNNCANGLSDDGASQCTGSTPNCCGPTSSCRNLATDFNNCLACGSVCNSLFANNCGMGGAGCRCGSNPPCAFGSGSTPGSWCNTGTCTTCNTKGHCGANCVDCGTNVCKADGSGCTECNTDGDCASNKWCNSGVCANDVAPGAACTRSEQCPSSAPNCIDTGPGTKVCCAQSTCGTCSTCATGTCQMATAGSTQPSCNGTNVCNNGVCGLTVGQSCAGSGCAFGNCVDGVCCNSSCNGSCQRCNVSGVCQLVMNATDDSCNAGRTCNGSAVCKSQNGQDCTIPLASECLTGNCVDGKCCDQTSATCGTCRTCNGTTPGTCEPVANFAQDTGCNSVGMSCNGSGNCVRDSGVACTTGSQCRSGVCTGGSTCQ